MNRKQRGAATEEEVTGEEHGWFARLRAQPGFRTAFVAFCLTVILGVGAPAAYALWSSTITANVTVKTAKPPLPVVGKPTCNDRGTTTVSWAVPPGGLPKGSVYLVQVSKIAPKSGTATYAFSDRTSFTPSTFTIGSHNFDDWMDGRFFNPTSALVTVSVAELRTPQTVTSPILVSEPATQIIRQSEVSPGTTLRSKSTEVWNIPWYDCP